MSSRNSRGLLATSVFVALAVTATAAVPTTERVYLSGKGTDDAVPWDFFCTGGRNSGKWTTIPVPSNWEFHGFGTYNYGHDPEKATEDGAYRREFLAPASWKGKVVRLVFDGAMTDTEVSINGAAAGPKHQGGFYRFEYDVTRLLKLGARNRLEVRVSKDSSDESVNAAERQADYWIFGGIYRPVYLKVMPSTFIDRVAVDARADGSFLVDVFVSKLSTDGELEAHVVDSEGRAVGSAFRTAIRAGSERATLTTKFLGIRSWSAERPTLYRVRVLLRTHGRAQHDVEQRFGFRTVEVRADGLYVNDRKLKLRGINRHTFWPDSGRATSAALSRRDVELIKDMNMNTVRMSHYPPDEHFLQMCDELGLYVFDELAGWQAPPYDTTIGERLVREMVVRDVNHPSVILWDNGNEGGWNRDLDDDFGLYDPQHRAVLHPDQTAGGLNTKHYPSYAELQQLLKGPTPYVPTEVLHGLYDGGMGAGLNDYWKAMRESPTSAGAVLWVFADEGIKRTDRNGAIDTDGNNAPDGILGPHREKEGSFDTVKEIWSPIQVDKPVLGPTFDGALSVENRYDFTDLSACRFEWALVDYRGPWDSESGHRVGASGTAPAPSIAPGAAGTLRLALPADWSSHDALALSAFDPTGRRVQSWIWPRLKPSDIIGRIVTTGGGSVDASETDEALTLRAGATQIVLDKATGKLAGVRVDGRAVSFGNGPIMVGKNVSALLRAFTHHDEGDAHVVECSYSGNLRSVRWTFYGSGWLRLDYHFRLPNRENLPDHDFFGMTFDYPEDRVEGVSWLGLGPYRVWKNRMRGPSLDVWSKAYNDTETGVTWTYPEFKGYHADLHWARVRSREHDFIIATPTEQLFWRLYTPRFTNAGLATAPFPTGDISFLHGIPAIGNKFQPAGALGPESGRHLAFGDFSATLYFYFGDPPAPR